MRRRGGPDGGAAGGGAGGDNPYEADDLKEIARRTRPVVGAILLAAAVTSPFVWMTGGGGAGAAGVPASRTAARSLLLSRGLGGAGRGGARHIRVPGGSGLFAAAPAAAAAAHDGANAGDGGSSDDGGDGSFASPLTEPWALTDGSYGGEGIRVEAVTAKPLSYGFDSTFCDVIAADGVAHQRRLLGLGGDDVGEGEEEVDMRTLRSSARNSDGSIPPPSDMAVCADARFFLVDQENEYSDKIVEYVTEHEGWVIELFAGILTASSCKPLPNSWPYVCRGGLSDELVRGRRVVVADYGANAGFFSQMAGRLGYPVITVEPQPHCVRYIRAASAVNGLPIEAPPPGTGPGSRRSAITLHHGFLAKGGALADGRTSMPLRRWTGCMGTWPIPLESKVIKYYDSLPGGNATVDVPVLDPASLIAEDDLVLLAKVDVEGAEVDVLYALEPHLKAGRILNLMVELNKRSYVPPELMETANREGFKEAFPVFTKVLAFMHDMGYTGLAAQYSKHLSWGTAPPVGDAPSIKAFVEDGWMTVNVWFPLHAEEAAKRAQAAGR